MRILLLAFAVFSSMAMAEVSRDEAAKVIDSMVKQNMISAEEGEKAKARLKSMSTTEWSSINKTAEEKAARMPASISVGDPATSDLSKEQFSAIESDLKAIAPHTQMQETVFDPTHVQEVVVAPVVVDPVVVDEVVVEQVVVEQVVVDPVVVNPVVVNPVQAVEPGQIESMEQY